MSGLIIPRNGYRNYAIRAPQKTHHRPASCAEVNCQAYSNGWSYLKSTLSADLLYAIKRSRKQYQEVDSPNGPVIVFEAGQPCFASHTVPLDRPAFFYSGAGTYQTFSTRKAKKYVKPEHWAEDMQITLDKIRTIRERG